MLKLFRNKNTTTIDSAILSSLGEAIVAFDMNGECIFMNAEAERLLQQDFKTARGKPITTVLPIIGNRGRLTSQASHPVVQVLKKRRKFRSKKPLMVRSGVTVNVRFPIDVNATPIRHRRDIVGVVVIFHDVTTEVTVDQMKSDFVSIVSHQLRTPLSTIRWFLEILAKQVKGPLNSDQERFVESAREAVGRMTHLINTLLNISRLESGKMKVTPRVVTMKTFLQSIIREMNTLARAHNVKLHYSKHLLGPTKIKIDRDLFHEVIENLISNAIKYSDPKKDDSSVTVTLRTGGGSMFIDVADNGIGIPEKDQFHIFEKFYRAENAQSQVASGNGLGLYIVEKILNDTGGRITFESKEGKGTTFSITLPRRGMKKRAGTRSLVK